MPAAGQKVKARVVVWHPVNSAHSVEDIAGLELEASPAPGVQPASLQLAEDVWEHPLRIFGFPKDHDAGIWATGVLRAEQAHGWVQLDAIAAQDRAVEKGFSGAPVWDEVLKRVVGMAVAAEKRREDVTAAFMIPNRALCEALGSRKPKPIILPTYNLSSDDWNSLFDQFILDDLADLRRAFCQAFKDVFKNDFKQVRPDHEHFTEPTQIRKLLQLYANDDNGLVLAVRFVEFTILEFQRSSQGSNRDLTNLIRWRDQITARHQVEPLDRSDGNIAQNAYLLVALEEIGSDVNAYPELRISGADKPTPCGVQPITCPIDGVVKHLSDWIRLAEEALENVVSDDEVTLEIFLPCKYSAIPNSKI